MFHRIRNMVVGGLVGAGLAGVAILSVLSVISERMRRSDPPIGDQGVVVLSIWAIPMRLVLLASPVAIIAGAVAGVRLSRGRPPAGRGS